VQQPVPHRRPKWPSGRAYRHVIFAVMLVVLGVVVAYLVHRVRTLSRYYAARRG